MEEADRARIVDELRACRARLAEVLAELRDLERVLSDGQPVEAVDAVVDRGDAAGEAPPVRLHSVR